MRSEPPVDDLSTRARIRNAAIALIGAHGFERTSMRMIANAAGVSAALVVHHFGDKEGLRSACDAHVTATFLAGRNGAEGANLTASTIQAALADLEAYGPALNYLAQMLSSGTSAADDLFDRLLLGTLRMTHEQEQAGVIRHQDDPEGTALVLTLLGLAPIVLRSQLARIAGEDRLTPTAVARLTIPTLEMLTHGIYTDDSALRAAKDGGSA